MEKTTQREASRSVLLTKCNSGGEINNKERVVPLAWVGGRRGSYRVLMERSEGRRPLGRPR